MMTVSLVVNAAVVVVVVAVVVVAVDAVGVAGRKNKNYFNNQIIRFLQCL
jgi:hypothetical protein